MKFHINPKTGDTGECKSLQGKCPFGGEANHFPDAASARTAFELSNAGRTFVSQENPPSRIVAEKLISALAEKATVVVSDVEIDSIDGNEGYEGRPSVGVSEQWALGEGNWEYESKLYVFETEADRDELLQTQLSQRVLGELNEMEYLEQEHEGQRVIVALFD